MFQWLTTFGLTSFLLLGAAVAVGVLFIFIDEWLNNLHSKFYIPYNLVLLALALLINFRMNSSYEHYSSNSAVILISLVWLYFYLALCNLCEFHQQTITVTKYGKDDLKKQAERNLNTYSTKKNIVTKKTVIRTDGELPALRRVVYAFLLMLAFALMREFFLGGLAMIVILGAPLVSIVYYFIYKFR